MLFDAIALVQKALPKYFTAADIHRIDYAISMVLFEDEDPNISARRIINFYN